MYQCLVIVGVILCQIGSGFAEQCVVSVNPPDPKSGCCGLANGNSLKKSTSIADIDEYPWMALIEFKKSTRIKLLCSAVLISSRYTLSAAQCFSKGALARGTPTNVRLGEYETTNEGKDCVEVKPGQEKCNDGAISIPIAKYISHPDFNFRKRHNDIAMIRLATFVPYTDFIRPICLPSLDITINAPKNLYMAVAGWGAANSSTDSRSNVLRRVHLPYVDLEICTNKYTKYNITIINRQLCAGSKDRDSCKGDSGGPLMYFNGKKMEVGGIVSYGPTLCGGQDIPGVYTKVYAYKEWIQSVIEEDSKIASSTSTTTTDSGLIYFRE